MVIEKGIYPLGISIGEGTKGGVFVTMVNENSVAAAAGLQYGDQLLEVWFKPVDFRVKSVQAFDFTVKAVMNSNSLDCHNFEIKTFINFKMCFNVKICMQNKILASKVQNLKQ